MGRKIFALLVLPLCAILVAVFGYRLLDDTKHSSLDIENQEYDFIVGSLSLAPEKSFASLPILMVKSELVHLVQHWRIDFRKVPKITQYYY